MTEQILSSQSAIAKKKCIHMLPTSLKTTLTDILSERSGSPVAINKASSIGGGCINDSFKVHTTDGVYFVKYNDSKRYPGMFEAEAKGLNILKKHSEAGSSPILLPGVIANGTDEHHSLLILEFIESGSRRKDFWESFSQGLSQLHRNTDTYFGLDHSNYIGSLPQSNRQYDNWIEFFIVERIEVQLRMALDNGRADRQLINQFQDLFTYLQDIFPEEPPSLLHGDLWCGNYMVGPDGQAAIVDPAVYYGHRYMDLGMTQLFGGFSPEFYDEYEIAFPMEKDWRIGTEVANLYPLLVHLNLFGSGYLGSIKTILRKFKR